MSATFPTVTAPEPGTLLGWGVAGGQLVEAGARLGEVLSAAGERLALLAPERGTITLLAKQRGQPVEAGQPLAEISPSRPSEALQGATRGASAQRGTRPPHEPKSPVASRLARHEPPSAPSAPREAPIVEELRLEAPEPLSPPPALATAAPSQHAERPPAKGERLRTKNRTYSIGTHHERAIARLAHELALDDSAPSAGESELVRAALSMLLDLPRPALVALVERNKARERAGGYGCLLYTSDAADE